MLASFTLSQMSSFNLWNSDHNCHFCSVFDKTNKLNVPNMKQKEKFLLPKERKSWPLEYANMQITK